MPAAVTIRPDAGDFGEYYARYTSLVPAGDLVAVLESQIAALCALLAPIDEARAGFAYAPGKWTVREVVGHITDTERVFAYRATASARGDAQPLPGFDQAAWSTQSGYDRRPLNDVLDEWITVRRATIALLRGMPADSLHGRGMASGLEITALACFCIIAGHVQYHVEHLETDYHIERPAG